MKEHLSNAIYGVLDYAAYPIGMLLVAPVLLRHLGVAQYGVWIVATAAVSTGSIIACGFGDANIQRVAGMRNARDKEALLRVVRTAMSIHLLLGASLALISWLLAPLATLHVASPQGGLRLECLWSLRIASLLMLVRAVESVCISTQRAFERYGAAVRISIAARLLTLALAVALGCCNQGAVSIMIVTAMLMVLSTVAQIVRLRLHLQVRSLRPAFHRDAVVALFSFGIFSWLQAVAGVIFTQADRLLLGVSLGATAVTSYTLCVQMAQPIHGLAASGLHFLFPYISGRGVAAPATGLRRTLLVSLLVNIAFVSVALAAVLAFGQHLLKTWAGEAVALSSADVLQPIAWGSALLALNVTGSYALLALGRVRTVTGLSVACGITMLALMAWLLPRSGVHGLAMARLGYGLISLLLYYPLIRFMRASGNVTPPLSAIASACEKA